MIRLLLLTLPLAGCKDKDPGEEQEETEDTTEPTPPAWDAEAAPIDCAYGTDAPLLDQALADAELADAAAVAWTESDWSKASYAAYLDDPFLLSWFYAYHHEPLRLPCLGGQLGADLDHAAVALHPVATALGEAMALLDHAPGGEPLDPLTATQNVVDLSSLPEDLAAALAPVFAAMELVAAARAAMEADAPADLDDLVEYGHGGILYDYDAEPDLTDDGAQAWILSESGPRALYDPARILAYAIEEADLGRFAGIDATFDAESDLGRIVIAGPGDDEPGDIGEIAFYLDLGGDDAYVHPAGASSVEVPVAVHVDLGGDDSYGYAEADAGSATLLPSDEDGRYQGDSNYGRFSLSKIGRQGSGRFGVGLLLDLGGGADVYRSLRASQGWGHLGVGALYDDGGDDDYALEAGGQGAASMGVGLLMDASGSDTRRAFVFSQGFGYLQAAGIAWDGGGDDTWWSDPGNPAAGGDPVYYSPQLPGAGNSSFTQGTGFGMRNDSAATFLSGGVGALRDAGGDDAYTASTFAQGSGYWQGMGLLLDGEGSDLYDAYYYVQGGAAHYAAGALLDGGPGDDHVGTRLPPVYMHFGAGHDFSAGVFVNESGDDTYVYGGLAAGASNCQGIGIFVDNDGTDSYTALSAYSTGLGNRSSECESGLRAQAPSIGLFLDSGGEQDAYAWVKGDGRAPGNDAAFGIEWNDDDAEHGGAVDGDGATGAHAAGAP